jgi:zinc/manganese transport system ATP-binding protein
MGTVVNAHKVAVRLHELSVAWQGRVAVQPLNGVFRAACLSAIVGPNGAGKSSLLAALAGTALEVSGRVDRMDCQRMAVLPQANDLDRQFPLRVDEFVAMGLWAQMGWLGGLNLPLRSRLNQAMSSTGLEGMGHRLMGELSVGQRQRARFARLILQDASLILLDEPFNAVDTRTTTDLLSLLPCWRAQGRTVIAVLHELDHVRQCFDDVLLLARQAVAWGPPAQVLTPVNLQRARKVIESCDDTAALSGHKGWRPSNNTPLQGF